MALGPQFRRPTLLAAALALVAVVGASPARADRCDDIAKELKNQIDGLKISMNTGNMIYLTHRQQRSCRSGAAAATIPSSSTPRATASQAGIPRSGRLHGGDRFTVTKD
jgi:hypothetical protein